MIAKVQMITKGALVPSDPWEGSVASVHQQAINIGHPAGYLVSLITNPTDLTVYSLLLARPQSSGLASDFFRSLFQRGMTVNCADSRLTTATCQLGLATGTVWEGTITGNWRQDSVDELRQDLTMTLSRTCQSEGLAGIVIRTAAANHFVERARTCLDQSLAQAQETRWLELSKLVGLGCGLTPAGDDFIVGVILAGEIVPQSGASLENVPLRLNRQTLRNRLATTTPAGRTLLLAALANRFPAYLVQLTNVYSVHTNQLTRQVALTEALAHGATSGTDTLAGLVWGLKAFSESLGVRERLGEYEACANR